MTSTAPVPTPTPTPSPTLAPLESPEDCELEDVVGCAVDTPVEVEVGNVEALVEVVARSPNF